jgi:hypothetical protein
MRAPTCRPCGARFTDLAACGSEQQRPRCRSVEFGGRKRWASRQSALRVQVPWASTTRLAGRSTLSRPDKGRRPTSNHAPEAAKPAPFRRRRRASRRVFANNGEPLARLFARYRPKTGMPPIRVLVISSFEMCGERQGRGSPRSAAYCTRNVDRLCSRQNAP